MRGLRILAQDMWYKIRTSVNNGEPLFRMRPNRDLFMQTLFEAREIYDFVLSGLQFSGPQVSFYIKPADGYQLPEIMQWIKQTFAVRFNVADGRTGHIWGDRYWSLILAGEPPEWAEAYVFAPVVCGAGRRAWRYIAADSAGRRPRNCVRETFRFGYVGAAGSSGDGRKCSTAAGNPARDAKGRPPPGCLAKNTRCRPSLPRRTAASHG
jgi:hypothetical protein